MVYRALGVWENASGLSLTVAEFHENAGKWMHEVIRTGHYQPGHSTELVNRFIVENNLKYQVALITFHTDSAGNKGAVIAAETELPVITNLPDLDLALGGNGEFLFNMAGRLGMNINAMTEADKATCVAFMGILRWREEYNFLSSVTGASRNSIGGAVWMGQEA